MRKRIRHSRIVLLVLGAGAVCGLVALPWKARCEAERAYRRIDPAMTMQEVLDCIAEHEPCYRVQVPPERYWLIDDYQIPVGEYFWANHAYSDGSIIYVLFNLDGSLHRRHFDDGSAARIPWHERSWQQARALLGL
jgi:hypothetical protein